MPIILQRNTPEKWFEMKCFIVLYFLCSVCVCLFFHSLLLLAALVEMTMKPLDLELEINSWWRRSILCVSHSRSFPQCCFHSKWILYVFLSVLYQVPTCTRVHVAGHKEACLYSVLVFYTCLTECFGQDTTGSLSVALLLSMLLINPIPREYWIFLSIVTRISSLTNCMFWNFITFYNECSYIKNGLLV